METGSGDSGAWGCAGEGVDVWLHATLWTEDVDKWVGGKSRSEGMDRARQSSRNWFGLGTNQLLLQAYLLTLQNRPWQGHWIRARSEGCGHNIFILVAKGGPA